MSKITVAVLLMAGLFLFVTGGVQAANTVDVAKLKKCAETPDKDQSLECFRKTTGDELQSVRSIISKSMETSYITFRSGNRLGADKTSGSMLYEAQIFKNISWDDRGIFNTNWHYWLDVPIRIGVRQLTVPSLPVRTPSFNPGLRWYLYDAANQDRFNPSYPFNYYSFGLHHYSNGQEGASTLPDGSVNTVDGSFNTNYAEFAFHRAWDSGALVRLAFRQHFYGTFETFQHDQYEKRHLAMELQSLTYRERRCLKWKCDYQLKLTETLGQGYKYIVKNDVNPAMNIAAKASDRLNSTIELIVKPASWEDMSIYLRYDFGYDYYNINFQNRMNRIQVGFIDKMF
jgi:hypothetical protein